MDLLPDFINYRRTIYPIKKDSIEEKILGIIRSCEGITSTELRKIILNSHSKFGMVGNRETVTSHHPCVPEVEREVIVSIVL